MLDDDRDKDLQRKQLIGMILMVCMLAASFYFVPGKNANTALQKEVPAATAPDKPAAPPVAALTPPSISPDNPVVPALPPVAEVTPQTQAEDEVALKNEQLELVFTRVGARLKRATVVLGDKGSASMQLVPETTSVPDAGAIYPMGLRFASSFLGDELDKRRWNATMDESSGTATFTIEVSGIARVVKTFRLSGPHTLDVNVDYVNLESAPRVLGLDKAQPAFSLTWGPNVSSGDTNKGVQQEIIWRQEGGNIHHPTAKLKLPTDGSGYSLHGLNPEWIAVKSAYFAVAMKPEFENAETWALGAPPVVRTGLPPQQEFLVGLATPRVEVAPGQTASRGFKVYLGPTLTSALKGGWPGLSNLLQFFQYPKLMDTFAKLLLGILNWFHDHVIANYGVAIIFLTILVRLVVFPLTMSSMKNMKKMQKLQPEMELIKKEAGDNQQEVQKKMMELYRERGVSPLGGCLPLFLQMPVFIALYRMLWSAFELRRAPFMLWMTDLSEPDHLYTLPFTIPLPFAGSGINSINVLPILGAIAMMLSTKFNPTSGPVQNQQQKMMMTIMPIFVTLICYNMASGLNLYIFISTLLGVAQTFFVQRIDINVDTKPKKTFTRPRHFYAAAQARKRQVAKEIRREKRMKDVTPDSSKNKRENKK